MIALVSLLLIAAPQGGGDRSTRPRSVEPMARWFADADYPVAALVRGAQGNVTFRLRIDEAGRLRKCAILTSAGDPALDAAACSILFARGRFLPAHDRDGRAVPGAMVARVRWVLPAEPEPWTPFVALRWVSVLHATADGAIDCAVATTGATVPVPLSECWLLGGPEAGEQLRALRMEATLTMVYTSVPAGQSLPDVAPADYGPLLYESAAHMSIAPNGRIADCRTVRNYYAMPVAGLDRPPDLCSAAAAGPGPGFAPAPGAAEVRHVRVSVSVYFRGSPAGPAP